MAAKKSPGLEHQRSARSPGVEAFEERSERLGLVERQQRVLIDLELLSIQLVARPVSPAGRDQPGEKRPAVGRECDVLARPGAEHLEAARACKGSGRLLGVASEDAEAVSNEVLA